MSKHGLMLSQEGAQWEVVTRRVWQNEASKEVGVDFEGCLPHLSIDSLPKCVRTLNLLNLLALAKVPEDCSRRDAFAS